MKQNITDDFDAWNIVFIIHFDKKTIKDFHFINVCMYIDS